MPVVIGPPVPPAGPLWWVGWYLDSFKIWLEHVGNSISDVFLLGYYLSSPFLSMAYYVGKAADYARDGDDKLQDIVAWVNGIKDGWLYKNLLYWVSSHFKDITDDASLWVKNRLASYSWFFGWMLDNRDDAFKWLVKSFWADLTFLIDDPLGWVKNKLFFISGEFWQITYNFGNWVRNSIRSHIPSLVPILDNPSTWVRDRIVSLGPDLWVFLYDPQRWLRDRIYAISYELGTFLDNPIGWLRAKVADTLGIPVWALNQPLYWLSWYLIREIRKSIMSFAETIKDLVIDLVMLFM